MKYLFVCALTAMFTATSAGEAFVGFPKSRTLKSLLEAYGEQVDLFAHHYGTDLAFRTYPMNSLDSAVEIAQNGLIAASPATVISLMQKGLTPVGYHVGQIPVGFHQLSEPEGDCLVVGILPKTSIMGAMTEYLIDGYDQHSLCLEMYPDISNLGRAALIGEVDAIVGSPLSLTRYIKSGKPQPKLIKSVQSPLFAFLTAPKHSEKWSKVFDHLASIDAKSKSGRPIVPWQPLQTAAYQTVHRLSQGDF